MVHARRAFPQGQPEAEEHSREVVVGSGAEVVIWLSHHGWTTKHGQ